MLTPLRWIALQRRRLALVVAIAVIAPYAVYLVFGNLALWLGIVSRVASQSPTTAQVDYGATFTWWPGRLWARDVRVAFQNDDFQFQLTIDEVTTDVSLFALFDKRFVADDVDAKGVSWRMRFKHTPENTRNVEALPPIPAFGPLALTEPPDDAPPDPKPWQVKLTGVRSQVKEVWIEFVRFDGDATVDADFEIVPRQHLRIVNAHGTIRDGEIESAGETIFGDTALRFRAAIPWFDIGSRPAEDIVAELTGIAEGTSTVDAGAAARRLRIVPLLVDVSGGNGQVWMRGGLEGERIVEGSVARYAGRDAGLTVDGASIQSVGHGDGQFLATATGFSTDGRLVAVEVVPKTNPTLRARFEQARVTADVVVPTLRTATFEGASFDLPVGAINLGAWQKQSLGDDVAIRRGAVFGRASMRIDRDMIASGKAHLEGYDAEVKAGPARVRGRSSADLALDAWDIGAGTIRFGKSWLELRDVDVQVGKERVAGWFGRFDVVGATIDPGDDGVVFRATVLTRARDATPVTALLDGEDLVPGVAADMLTMEGLRAEARLVVDGRRFDADLVDASGDGASAAGRFVFAGGDKRGAVVARVGPISAGVGYGDDDTWLRVLAGSGWLEGQRADIDGWLSRTLARGVRAGPVLKPKD